jgi:threonine/homoserine/homoserine lactone efflux protein
MAPFETLLAFAIATALFAYVPGPALLYTAARTLAGGRRAGFMAAFGIHLGCYAHVAAAALGLSAIFQHVPEAYLALKMAGAVYLLWLGVSMFRARPAAIDAPAPAPRTARRAFVDSVIVEVLNPKTALFFIAFLPQFVDPSAALPLSAQFVILGVFVNLAFSLADVVTVLAASFVMGRVRRSGATLHLLRYAAGSLLVGLGLKLAIAKP